MKASEIHHGMRTTEVDNHASFNPQVQILHQSIGSHADKVQAKNLKEKYYTEVKQTIKDSEKKMTAQKQTVQASTSKPGNK